MSTPRLCPRCREPIPLGAPEGSCPRCLVRMAIELGTKPALPLGTFEPPAEAELNAQFSGLKVQALIGAGGMGVVYKARQEQLDRVVAIKVLPPSLGLDPMFVERFLREAKALARLQHPHIVTVYDSGLAGDFLYIVMEYVDGPSLRVLLQQGRLTTQDAMRLAPQICDALQYAHDRGVIHRDIKPENVLIDGSGAAKIADFGLASLAEPESTAPFPLTTEVRMGTPRYMAPEQFRNTADVDHRADIYSLGILFYEMLTGDLPTIDYTPPSRKSGVDSRLDRVVRRAIKESPAKRYQRAADVKRDVERIAKLPNPRRVVAALAIGCALFIASVAAFLPRNVALRTGKIPASEVGPAEPANTVVNPVTEGVVVVDPEWRLERTIDLGDAPAGVQFHPRDGRLFFCIKNGAIYEVRGDEPPVKALDVNAVALAFTPDGQSLFYSDEQEGVLVQVDFPGGLVSQRYDYRPRADDDPSGLAFAPENWTGRAVDRDEGLLVDLGYQGPRGLWRFGLHAKPVQVARNVDELKRMLDVAFSRDQAFVTNSIPEVRSRIGAVVPEDMTQRIYRLEGDRLVGLRTDRPVLDPCGIACDLSNSDLYVLSGRFLRHSSARVVYRLRPSASGSLAEPFHVSEVMTGLVISAVAGIDLSLDNTRLAVADAGSTSLHILRRDPGSLSSRK